MLLSCRTRQKKYNITTGSLLFVTSFLLLFTPSSQYYGFNGGALTRTLETLQTHACDGDQLKIICPTRTVISIQYAKYGRSVPSSKMCAAVTMKPTFRDLLLFGDMPMLEDTNCIAVRSLEVMLDLCEDRSSCSVRASPETFTQDPCEGTSKYLEAHYKCRPNQFESRTVCEGDELELWCGKGDRIAVYSAMFGRTPNGTEECPANKLGYIDCQATGTVSEVRGQCHGRKNCAILANESVFGDPCATGINKYLTVSYACVPKKILKQFHRKANRKKKRKKKKKKKGGKDDVTHLPDDSNTSEATPTKSSHDHIPDSSFPEVYETYEQSSVTQILPDSATDSPSHDNNEKDPSASSANQNPDITTLQDDAKSSMDVITEAPGSPKGGHPKHDHSNGADKSKDGGSDSKDGGGKVDDVTDSYSSSSFDVNGAGKDPGTAYNSRDQGEGIDSVSPSFSDNSKSDSNTDNPRVNNLPGSSGSSNNNNNNNNDNYNSNGDNLGRVRDNNPGANPTNNPPLDTTLNSLSRNKGQGSKSDLDPNPSSNPNNAKGSKDSGSPYVTERNLTVLCINYTRPGVRWGELERPKSERTIGFLKDWFSAIHFLDTHSEKAWLYFTLGICFGIIVMLIIVLIKVCINFRRNTRARLDVSEPTHRSAFTNNHSSLDAPMLEHSDSIDRIEVVRFSPRSTLRSLRSNSHHRDLVNYYG